MSSTSTHEWRVEVKPRLGKWSFEVYGPDGILEAGCFPPADVQEALERYFRGPSADLFSFWKEAPDVDP